ncbi:MAG: hypothetical protein ACTSSJ_04180 [Candidatus Odinarchaeia archaeon]
MSKECCWYINIQIIPVKSKNFVIPFTGEWANYVWGKQAKVIKNVEGPIEPFVETKSSGKIVYRAKINDDKVQMVLIEKILSQLLTFCIDLYQKIEYEDEVVVRILFKAIKNKEVSLSNLDTHVIAQNKLNLEHSISSMLKIGDLVDVIIPKLDELFIKV